MKERRDFGGGGLRLCFWPDLEEIILVILLVGPAVGIIATVSSLIVSLRTPIHQLPLLNWYPK